jgi:hypothetical protein
MTVKTHAVQFRVTPDEHVRLQQRAAARGFHGLATYLRYCGLEHDFVLLDKISDIQRRMQSLEARLLSDAPRTPDRVGRRNDAAPRA